MLCDWGGILSSCFLPLSLCSVLFWFGGVLIRCSFSLFIQSWKKSFLMNGHKWRWTKGSLYVYAWHFKYYCSPITCFFVIVRSTICFCAEGQKVIGEPIASGLALDESWLWHPDFDIAAKQVPSLVSMFFSLSYIALNCKNISLIRAHVSGM